MKSQPHQPRWRPGKLTIVFALALSAVFWLSAVLATRVILGSRTTVDPGLEDELESLNARLTKRISALEAKLKQAEEDRRLIRQEAESVGSALDLEMDMIRKDEIGAATHSLSKKVDRLLEIIVVQENLIKVDKIQVDKIQLVGSNGVAITSLDSPEENSATIKEYNERHGIFGIAIKHYESTSVSEELPKADSNAIYESLPKGQSSDPRFYIFATDNRIEENPLEVCKFMIERTEKGEKGLARVDHQRSVKSREP